VADLPKGVLMNKIKTAVVAVIMIAVTPMLFATQAKAEQCFTQYGGGETCVDRDAKIKVNKEIYNPKTKDWEDHISSSQYQFEADEKIRFRITVKNVGDIEIKDIRVVDVLPDFVSYKDGDGDKISKGKEVEFDKFDLEPGEDKDFEFRVKVASSGILPKDDKICLSNIAKAKGVRSDKESEKEDAVDYANFCIDLPSKSSKEKIKYLPKTGFDFVPAILSAGLVIAGLGIKKFSKD
jgi:uncharacterized repeat protein (TIGR01451 family)